MYTGHQYPQFFTASCSGTQMLLEQDKYKERLIEDLRSLTEKGWIKVYAFVIMPNHCHYLWQVHPSLEYTKVREIHLNAVAKTIQQDLMEDSQDKAAESPLWEADTRSIDLYTPKLMYQKLEYIHGNPAKEKWQLCQHPKEYVYSSAEFYSTGLDRFSVLTHIGARGVWEKEPDRIQVKSF